MSSIVVDLLKSRGYKSLGDINTYVTRVFYLILLLTRTWAHWNLLPFTSSIHWREYLKYLTLITAALFTVKTGLRCHARNRRGRHAQTIRQVEIKEKARRVYDGTLNSG